MLISLKQIVAKQLREYGCSGLVNPELECGCGIDDLMPCGHPDLNGCMAATGNDETGYFVANIPYEKTAIYAVINGNYFPYEVDSMWRDYKAAESHAVLLNSKNDNAMWRVVSINELEIRNANSATDS